LSASNGQDGPLSPAVALVKFRRVLTEYEQNEIKKYQNIWYVGPTARKIDGRENKGPNSGYDDDKGRYKCVKNDHIGYRYEVQKGLGKGSFGDVVKVYDHKTKTHSALKIIRNERRFHKQAQIEIKLLDLLRRQDKRNSHNVIHMADYFLFRGHLCITFEMMYSDLYAALKKGGFRGFTNKTLQAYASSLVTALRVLRRSRIIHCDLKPENILLKSPDSNELKVIDFGSSCFDHQRVHTYIQSRFYRAPEVIMGLGYGVQIDMWSLGCIMAELYTGQPLFPGHDEKEQLMYQMEMLGVPPLSLINQGKRSSMFFTDDGKPLHMTDRKGRVRQPKSRTLASAIKTKDPAFHDFIWKCLTWDPNERMTPREAAHHEWLAGASMMNAMKRLSVEGDGRRRSSGVQSAGTRYPKVEEVKE
jgi:serine/threonine protein kinase